MAETLKSNLNTVLMFVTLGVLGWLAVTAQNTAVSVAQISVSLDEMTKDLDRSEKQILVLDARLSLLERQVDKLTPRP